MGIDPGYGSSSFGIVITQPVDQSQVQVLYADEYQRPDFNEMLNVTVNLINTYDVQKVYIDAANPSFIRALKMAIGEREDYENQISYYKQLQFNWHNHMKVIPVSFNVGHKEMIGHAKMLKSISKYVTTL